MHATRLVLPPVAVAVLLLVGCASARPSCGTHPQPGASAAELAAAAQVNEAAALATAIASLGSTVAPTAVDGELEVEHGCLLYSFDIQLPGRDGVEEVQVDAGSGLVLGQEHESSRRERAEATAERH